MTTPRCMFVALVIMIMFCFVRMAGAQSTCVPLEVCPSDHNYSETRAAYSSKTWFVGPMPGSPYNDRIYLTNDQIVSHVQEAFRAYSNLDAAVPYDYTSTVSGDVTFGWGWVPRSEIQSNPNRRTGVAGAAMVLDQTDCHITYSVAKFAYDISDGVRLMCWTGDWCNPPWCTTTLCGDTTNVDFLAAGVHEYGHALGLDHSTTTGATMFASLSAMDTTGRQLIACEQNMVVKTYHDQNAAATVTGYSVTGAGGDVTIAWNAEQEQFTDHYVLEEGSDQNGPFTSLSNVQVNGAGSYAIHVSGSASSFYRLTEVETDGDRLPLWCEPVSPTGSSTQFEQLPFNFDSTLTALYANRVQAMAPTTGPTQFYIYCPDSLAETFQSLADAHSQWEGVPTEVVTYESIGGVVNQKSHTATHLPNGGWVLKVGDAWEGKDVFNQPWRGNDALYVNNGFTKSTWPDQPQLNISPMTYRRDLAIQPMSLAYWTPFVATPSWPVDFNNDGLPDPGYYLGYAPVSTKTEAQVFVAKSIQQMFTPPNPPGNMMPSAQFMTYALDYGSNSGARAKQMSDTLATSIRAVNNRLMLGSTLTWAGNRLTMSQRNAALKARFDAGMSSVSFVSTVSQRYEMGAYAHVDIPGYVFDVNALASNGLTTFGVLLTCEAGFARTEDPAYGTPVTERLLFVPNRGFWGFFGPDRGTFQGGNERIGKIFYRRQYSTPAGAIPPTVGELWNGAVREGAAFKPDSLLAITYILVGDPRGRIPSPGQSVVSVGPEKPIERPLTLMPNPVRGTTSFSFSLATAAAVDLSIYDVTGRRVTTVLKAFLLPGAQSVRWNTHDVAGQNIKPGIYFARLQVGNRISNHKVAFLQ